ncbi:hypothetical protein Q5752_003416 [Cryptotrichosporon argae]
MRATALALALAPLLACPALALSSWYTKPGDTPAGSVAGDKVRGVNLGGWLILENWMMPSLFEVSPLDEYTVNDEWTYCQILGKAECLSRLETHWDTWVTEEDFARFANYSLNTVRIPIGYWAWTELEDYEPYVQGQLSYLERALNWATKYGLDVMMDLHGLPGGQNGQDNQGYKGPIEFQNNATNLDRALAAMANLTAFVTADRFEGTVTAIELTNEPYITEYSASGMEFDVLADYYTRAYAVVRANEYIQPANNEVMVVIHDAFQPLLNWMYFWSEEQYGANWTNYALDTHIYDAFGTDNLKSQQEHLDTICAMSADIAAAQAQFPVIVGEFSLGVNTYCVDYRSCFGLSLAETIANLTSYDESLFLRAFWEVQVDAYELGAGWILWSHRNELAAPWSWTQSAAQNWIPEDPTEKIWPFNANVSSSCLDLANPLAGDQNMPAFPTDAADPKNVTILVAKTTANATSSSSAAFASSSKVSQSVVPGLKSASATQSQSSATSTTAASSGARRLGPGADAGIGASALGAMLVTLAAMVL